MGVSKPSDEVCKRIRDNHPEVDPIEFHEFVRAQLGQNFSEADGIGNKDDVPRVVEFFSWKTFHEASGSFSFEDDKENLDRPDSS